MIRSITLPSGLSSDIGLWLDGSFSSPFLGIGITYQNFQHSGKIPSLIKRLKRVVKGLETSLATDLSHL